MYSLVELTDLALASSSLKTLHSASAGKSAAKIAVDHIILAGSGRSRLQHESCLEGGGKMDLRTDSGVAAATPYLWASGGWKLMGQHGEKTGALSRS